MTQSQCIKQTSENTIRPNYKYQSVIHALLMLVTHIPHTSHMRTRQTTLYHAEEMGILQSCMNSFFVVELLVDCRCGRKVPFRKDHHRMEKIRPETAPCPSLTSILALMRTFFQSDIYFVSWGKSSHQTDSYG